MWIGPTPGNVSLPGGCTLYILPPIFELPGNSSAAGLADVGIAIPADPAMRRVSIRCQGMALDPNGAFFGMAVMSPGLALVIGD